MHDTSFGYIYIMDDIIQFTNDIIHHLTDHNIRDYIRVMGYIIAYCDIPIWYEPWLVLPAVSIAKSVRETFINPFQAGQLSRRYHLQRKWWL
jgi:hypothetical protein